MEERIIEFIKEHHLLTLAVTDGKDVWCASAFYAFAPSLPGFVIASEEKTRHVRMALGNVPPEGIAGSYAMVAGTVALETEKIGMIRGLQFRAVMKKAGDSAFDEYRLLYLKRFPYALLKKGDLWLLELTEVKFTDNRLGFGKKLHWENPLHSGLRKGID